MKKELVFAIFIGLLIGFGLAAVFWVKTPSSSLNFISKNEKKDSKQTTPTKAPEPTQEEKPKVTLKIINPDNEIVHPQEELTISGETLPYATVVIIWQEGEDILVADENGKFENEITLIGGENRIDITAYNDQGDKASQTLTVTYSTAEF